MASIVYNNFKYRQLGDTGITPINLKTDTIKLALVTSGYTPADAHDFFDDVSSSEVAASGSYATGGATLTVTTSQDNTNDRGVFDASDVAFTTFTGTARGAVIYKSTGVNSTSPLVCYIDFTTDQAASAGTFTITFSATGIMTLS